MLVPQKFNGVRGLGELPKPTMSSHLAFFTVVHIKLFVKRNNIPPIFSVFPCVYHEDINENKPSTDDTRPVGSVVSAQANKASSMLFVATRLYQRLLEGSFRS